MSLIDKIAEAGVVGAGGAGFPTHVKYGAEAEYFIINGAECEPLLMTDKFLMRSFAAEILEAIDEVAKIVGADKVVFALKKKYTEELACLKRIRDENNYDIEFFLMESYYPAGDEQVMVYEITGRTVPEGGIPLHVGAVVSNVGTLYNVYRAIRADKAVTDKYVSVLAEVNKPRIVKVPIGTSINECIEAAGGSTLDEYAVIIGGPMMGENLVEEEAINQAVITKTAGSIIILPKKQFVIEMNQQSMEHIKNKAEAACIQCTFCTEYCPRYLIGHENLEPHRIMRALAYEKEDNTDIFKTAQLCCECGICELYACPMGLSPRLVNVYYKQKIDEKYETDKDEFKPHIMQEYRKIPTDRQIARLNLSKYNHQELHEPVEIEVDKVKIPLNQHIGAPAELIVSEGQTVERGQKIAKIRENALGANIHASISGKVIKADDNQVIISGSAEVVS
ncbi:4Fe-4S dicluster domain-containing protein [Halanaerobium hydrogeniformans]|uniref:Respiratory-chain NADH dehydrogenase domain 51 kDa subunit n=1 Tax=Halanaerobium hydrogeniformans TaxID=656519 RepID=E4RMB0_HALHG|nr:4Fe-4S dicluster domain-containing protein [Halanaerobium hydrogeniformans]ADQ14441.1 Respiratory-chain NADH dehydrogenase domain 51 kDa subunit [Halanaerobium hydrogeniformans]